jgi:hypothetical protein
VIRLPANVNARPAVVPAIGWVATVAAVGAAGGARVGWVKALAASPDRVREAKLWFLFTSAFLVDRPVVVSVLSFAALATLAWLVCGARVFWLAAFLGQIAATLLVYLFIAAARQLVSGAFGGAIASPDYGVSTVSAAWLGAIAAVAWRRRARSYSGRASIAVGCIAVGLFAYSLRPDLTVLSSEHVVAFVLGVGAAVPGLSTALVRRVIKAPLDWSVAAFTKLAGREVGRATAALTLTAALAALAVVAAPDALGTLRQEIALHLPPTKARCAADWNRVVGAPRSLAAGSTDTLVDLAVARVRLGPGARSRSYCRYEFDAKSRAIVVLGRWRHGTVAAWIIETAPRHGAMLPTRANATLQARGRIRLDRPRPTLSS